MEKKILILSTVIIILICFGSYFVIKSDFEKVKEVSYSDNGYDVNIEYEIEDIQYNKNDIVIKAWVVEIGSENKYINRSILLKDSSEKIISIKTESQEREDLVEKNTEKTSYKKSGLIARVNKNKLTATEKYQIGFNIINQQGLEKIIFTDKTIEIN